MITSFSTAPNAIITSAHKSHLSTPNRLNAEMSQRRVGHAESSHVESVTPKSPAPLEIAKMIYCRCQQRPLSSYEVCMLKISTDIFLYSGNPVKAVLARYKGISNTSQRNSLTADSVSEDHQGLQHLIVCYKLTKFLEYAL